MSLGADHSGWWRALERAESGKGHRARAKPPAQASAAHPHRPPRGRSTSKCPQKPYLIKVQNSKEVLGVLLGNLEPLLRSHAAVTGQAVTQKDLGISQLMEFSLLRKTDEVFDLILR